MTKQNKMDSCELDWMAVMHLICSLTYAVGLCLYQMDPSQDAGGVTVGKINPHNH